MKKGSLSLLVLLLVFGFIAAAPLLAQTSNFGTDLLTNSGLGSQDIRLVMANFVRVALEVLGIILLVIIIAAGLRWMTAGGNEEAVAVAKKMISSAVIGLLIVALAYSLAIWILHSLSSCDVNQNCNPPDPPVCIPVTEVCGDSIDNDCDGDIDEDCSSEPPVCIPVTEVCGDGIDNDCDGDIDEDCGGGLGLPLEEDADYFVDSTIGDDANDGKSKETAFATIQKAADSAVAGDEIVVLPGSYGRTVVTSSGSSGLPIVFRASNIATVAGSPANTISADALAITKGFHIIGDYVTIEGFEITETTMDGHVEYHLGSGIYVAGKECALKNNYIHHTGGPGISLYAQSRDSDDVSFCLVADNTIHDSGDANVLVRGTNHTLQGNDLSRALVQPRAPDSTLLWTNQVALIDADPIRMNGDFHRIVANYLHGISHNIPGNEDAHLDWIEAGPEWRHAVIERNIFYHTGTHRFTKPNFGSKGIVSTSVAGSNLGEVDDIVIQNNIFIHNGSGFSPLVRIGKEGEPTITNIKILNNTFIRTKTTEWFMILRNIDGLVVQNNIFYSGSDGSVTHTPQDYWSLGSISNSVISHNMWYAQDGIYTTSSPWPDDIWRVDPLFSLYTGDEWGVYGLQALSPAIDVGVSQALVSEDYVQTPRPQRSEWDIGAFEKE